MDVPMEAVVQHRAPLEPHTQDESTPLPFSKPTTPHYRSFFGEKAKFATFSCGSLTVIASQALVAANLDTPPELAKDRGDVAELARLLILLLPVVSLNLILSLLHEYAIREWVYYRLLEHGVLLKFPSRRYSSSWVIKFIWVGAALTAGALLYGLLSGQNTSQTVQLELVTATANVCVQAYMLAGCADKIRQLRSRTTSITELVGATDHEAAMTWLNELTIMEEVVAKYHFLHSAALCTPSKEAIHQRSLSQSRLQRLLRRDPLGDTIPVNPAHRINFATVGTLGYSEQSLSELLKGPHKPAFTIACSKSNWASGASHFALPTDQQFCDQVKKWRKWATICATLCALAGISTSGQMWNKLSKIITASGGHTGAA